jgi:hypothetical protein
VDHRGGRRHHLSDRRRAGVSTESPNASGGTGHGGSRHQFVINVVVISKYDEQFGSEEGASKGVVVQQEGGYQGEDNLVINGGHDASRHGSQFVGGHQRQCNDDQ